MITEKSLPLEHPAADLLPRLGTLSYLIIFAWSLGMVMLVPSPGLLVAGAVSLLVAALIYPRSFRRLMQPRWLVMLVVFALPPVFLLGELDRSLWGLSYSSEGVSSSIQIMVRIIVVLVAVDGFTSSVDISSIAGLLERLGLRGLGFSMGVALNLLPSLQTAAIHTWHSLWMRGGLRRRRWRSICLLLMTVITNALRRTEEIALAAEGRAFCPETCRALPMRSGTYDRLVLVVALASAVGLFLVF